MQERSTAFYVAIVVVMAVNAGGRSCLASTLQGQADEDLVMREVKFENWRIRLDLRNQVLGLDIPDDRVFGDARGNREAPIQPVLRPGGGAFVSASALAQKAKQFDDGLYAAVDLAAQSGAGRFAGKRLLLEAITRALADRNPGRELAPLEVIFSAARLGAVGADPLATMRGAVDRRVQAFLADELRAKPIGFYTWSKQLEAIFQQDRMLQTELEGRAGIEELAGILYRDQILRAAYEGYLELISRLTNPLVYPDLRRELAQLDQGTLEAPARGRYFLPPSMSHETELVKRLYGDRPIPAGFNLAEELMSQIRAGKIQLEPRNESGWYDYQTWSLEPMAIPEKMPESKHLQFSDSYRKQLRELFKGILALTRETHIKQLEIPAPAAAVRPNEERKVVTIYPELSAEPLATHYLRRAIGYRFVHGVLRQTFGSDAINSIYRLTAEGPVDANLNDELDEMESLFFGAYVTICRQIGMSPDTQQLVGSNEGADADVKRFIEWTANWGEDADIAQDARMMVPVFFDQRRGKTKVWAFLGWSNRPVRVSFAMAPAVEVQDELGKKLDKYPLDIQFRTSSQSLPYPVTAEVYVTQILNRAEFRKHCDQFKTQEAILKNLK